MQLFAKAGRLLVFLVGLGLGVGGPGVEVGDFVVLVVATGPGTLAGSVYLLYFLPFHNEERKIGGLPVPESCGFNYLQGPGFPGLQGENVRISLFSSRMKAHSGR
ncbi:hypothetical protein BDZ91DRAFT_785533 [Kalaharituber pfeilii]|nr:hypothetical protein BDZ91DRAFT_785533 [Kalaharituber pfeilii]